MAAKRKRNYKAEYNRRIAKAAAAGKTRQQARGHVAKEHVRRAQRSRAKYGATPAQLTKLRKAAKGRLLAVYERIARNPVNERTVARGMKYLHAEDLKAIIDRDDMATVSMIKQVSPLSPEADSYYDQLAEYFPESIDDLAGDDINPLWYHR